MDVVAALVAPCPPDELFRWVEDLGRYPEWLEIVTRAEPLTGGREGVGADVGDDGDGDGDADGAGPAWAVDLRGRLGPLARSKRLRMVRTRCVAPTSVLFERVELDGRHHSPWVLQADVTPDGAGAALRMRLHYGGGLFGPVLERVLRDEIERSRLRLLALVSA